MPATAQYEETDERTEKKDLKLEVTDFGPIAKADVDLRPLMVFVGASNTGKSYLAILIYALHRFFNGGTYSGKRHSFGGWRSRLEWGFGDFSEEEINTLSGSINAIEINSSPPNQGSIVLPPPFADRLRSGFSQQMDTLSHEIVRCFGVDEIDRLVRRNQAVRESCLVMRQSVGDPPYSVHHTVSLSEIPAFETMIPEKIPIPIDSRAGDRRQEKWLERMLYLFREDQDIEYRLFVIQDLLSSLGNVLIPSLFGTLHSPAYYLPADRTGVMHAHNVVVNALIASASAAGIIPAANTPMLSGVLADFLEQLVGFEPIRKGKRDLGRSIEDNILDGAIRITRPANYPNFTYRPRGWEEDLTLANASSMVSELAPVVLYLRHVIKPGNVLIVEEPESHLHPAMQVKFIREIAALIKIGVRVIVTTHSEWLLEELANIVRRSHPKVRHNGSDEIALDTGQVGVWLFEPEKYLEGTVVKEVYLDDSNLYSSGFDDVAYALHNDSADITSLIENNS